MKNIFTTTLLSLIFATCAFATTQEFNGTGMDNNPCTVKVIRNGEQIQSIELTGAAETFEILSENGDHYGPVTEIDNDGARKMLELFHNNNQMFSYMKVSTMIFEKGEVISFNLNDMPETDDNSDISWLNMKFSMNLYYDKKGNIKQVKAQSKMKTGIIFTLASQRFTCK
ncbi:MAG: hypothetical protein A2381_14895 [Bdellovibrionales bacterium RIFOXYB1_FULL_37_110]|nr:MAG: hypothetical protein A2417_10400 [Bdellovibrionales bacterium RIFOXYC1_FULL_37_79]OFZ60152.1 MAG: hypothetical protein A2381_14895 [Bdellovibrionales bacterium RIFOXYB1_FULL_37_110]OFZ64354.1 MAG: hypothetical protein A2577_09875 [Bdellovibrionales bacterium RIFOXYD1_FULL_36_51]